MEEDPPPNTMTIGTITDVRIARETSSRRNRLALSSLRSRAGKRQRSAFILPPLVVLLSGATLDPGPGDVKEKSRHSPRVRSASSAPTRTSGEGLPNQWRRTRVPKGSGATNAPTPGQRGNRSRWRWPRLRTQRRLRGGGWQYSVESSSGSALARSSAKAKLDTPKDPVAGARCAANISVPHTIPPTR